MADKDIDNSKSNKPNNNRELFDEIKRIRNQSNSQKRQKFFSLVGLHEKDEHSVFSLHSFLTILTFVISIIIGGVLGWNNLSNNIDAIQQTSITNSKQITILEQRISKIHDNNSTYINNLSTNQKLLKEKINDQINSINHELNQISEQINNLSEKSNSSDISKSKLEYRLQQLEDRMTRLEKYINNHNK